MMAHAVKPKHDAGRDIAASFSTMAGKRGATVTAAWPSGLSQITQAYVACQRCVAREACADVLTGAPDSIQIPPAFCPNGAEFARINKAKSRG